MELRSQTHTLSSGALPLKRATTSTRQAVSFQWSHLGEDLLGYFIPFKVFLFEHTGRETSRDRPTTRENYFDDRSLLCPVILDKDGHCFTEASGQDLCLK